MVDQSTYQRWWELHLRVARGESLNSDEQSFYDTKRQDLEQHEDFPQNMEARELREELAALEKVHAELEKRRRHLDSQIADLNQSNLAR